MMNVAGRSLPTPLLQIPLVFGTFIAPFCGIVSSSAENPPRRVNGIIGGSASLPLNISSTNAVIEIEWMFQTKDSGTLLIAEFRKGELQRPDPSDRFGKRLEMANETTLRILNLEMEDRGLYKARAKLTASEAEDHAFSLAVYDQIQDVQILHRLVSSTPEGCNVTLQCHSSGKGELNFCWKGGETSRALENGSDWYRLSENGTALHLFWQPNPSDSIITCFISNPVDQKMVSVSLLSICPNRGFGIWVWKKKRKTPRDQAY
ncbi:SLAM family member 6-like isoform X2 [Hemicordylus capensis]|uniref:SLAM family member 6-like isoform X2 n=1 Tax=Hemicordylus capensis TaxID=884348 RepID=UPI002304197C|nr:SLAM family member 6-like isoform X2 [Hemicordylus capensis]